MSWLADLGKKIAAKLGYGKEASPEEQKAVLESIEETTFEPERRAPAPPPAPMQDPEKSAGKIYRFLESTCDAGTSRQWKTHELKSRMMKKFPALRDKKLDRIIQKVTHV